MPAVQLTRLRAQVDDLNSRFSQPAAYLRSLRDLLELYADRTYQPGQGVPSKVLVPSYHVPILVMRHLESSLENHAREDPAAALPLADLLWQEEYLEPRLLASSALGQAPLDPPEQVLDRLVTWARTGEEPLVRAGLFLHGTDRLRQEQPGLWLQRIQVWLSDPDLSVQMLGLEALLPLVRDPHYEDLPPIFPLVQPLFRSAPPPLLPVLQNLLEALARRSSVETAYILRQILTMQRPPALSRLVRRCLPAFDPAEQAMLKSLLR
jgi:hypothetical protein